MRIVRRDVVAIDGDWPDDVHPVLRRIYAARGVRSAADARVSLRELLPPDGLGGLDAALDLLCEAIDADLRILVVGDFDCDGATGTAVAVHGLRMLGARRVGYRVPHRMRHGYGLSPALVEDIGADIPDLLITVDSGIACVDGIAAARARGMRVLVTDHHLPGERLPCADAIVNPNAFGDAFASKALAGVGVVFYLLVALRRRLREAGRFDTSNPEPDLATLLDLVAVGTVADLVPLDRNNRVLVAAGLKRLQRGDGNPGLRALAEVAGREVATLSTTDIAFSVAPRLNAAGRLEDMSLGIACLLADDRAQALEYAMLLHQINGERQALQADMLEQAEQLAARCSSAAETCAVVVFDPDWHAGVVGLVASKLKERMHRPVVALAPGGGDGLWRGSARSIPGLHVRDVLADVDARHPGLMARFGGHAMAAGLSIAPANLEAFADAFVAAVRARVDPDDLDARLLSDGPLSAADICRALCDQLRAAGPWGQGFPPPLFDNVVAVRDWRVVGERHLKLSLDLDGAGVSAIHFGGWDGQPPPPRLHVAYSLEPDDFRDRRDVQLVVRHRAPHLG